MITVYALTITQVLQEVAAARQIVVMDNHDEMDGDSFCLGLERLELQNNPRISPKNESHWVRSATRLIQGAGLRSRMTPEIKTLLGKRSIAGLVNLFQGHEATDRRDKVFALLGLSLGAPIDLSANYDISWGSLFHQLVKSCFDDDQAYIETWDDQEIAIMKIKVLVLGRFVCIPRYSNDSRTGTYSFCLQPTDRGRSVSPIPWNSQTAALPSREGDILCLLSGATTLAIIRPLRHHTYVYCAIISIAENPGDPNLFRSESRGDEPDGRDPVWAGLEDLRDWIKSTQQSGRSIAECWLVWDWGMHDGEGVENDQEPREEHNIGGNSHIDQSSTYIAGELEGKARDVEYLPYTRTDMRINELFTVFKLGSNGIPTKRTATHLELMAKSKIRKLPETFQDMASSYESYGRLLALAGQ